MMRSSSLIKIYLPPIYVLNSVYCLFIISVAGEYLALMGEKLNGAEMIACGLATHYAHSAVKFVGF